MKKLVIDPALLHPILVDAKLYEMVPALDAVRAEAEQAYYAVLRELLANTCYGCSPLRKIVRPIFDRICRLLAADREAAAGFARYVARKRGYAPSRIVMYYVDAAGKDACLEI